MIQLFDMTIPFWRKCSRHRIFDGGRARTKFTARLTARNCASADRHDAGAPWRRVKKPGAQIEAVSRNAELRAHNKSAKQSDGHERMNVGPGMGWRAWKRLKLRSLATSKCQH
jgi:hypothetical protein